MRLKVACFCLTWLGIISNVLILVPTPHFSFGTIPKQFFFLHIALWNINMVSSKACFRQVSIVVDSRDRYQFIDWSRMKYLLEGFAQNLYNIRTTFSSSTTSRLTFVGSQLATWSLVQTDIHVPPQDLNFPSCATLGEKFNLSNS